MTHTPEAQAAPAAPGFLRQCGQGQARRRLFWRDMLVWGTALMGLALMMRV